MRIPSRLSRPLAFALVAVSFLVGAQAASAAAGFTAPEIRAFSAKVAPCPESKFRCIDVSWKARDASSPGLLYDLIAEHSGGRVTFEGEGAFRPGKTLRASLVPPGRPLCGTYTLTLTVTNQSGILSSRVVTVARRSTCIRRDPRLK